jgi:hypothetical protein
VSIDEVGAPGRRGRVAGRRLGDRLKCSAEGHEPEHGKRWIEERAPRPVVERAARASHRPHHQEREENRPDPSRPAQQPVARPDDQQGEADGAKRDGWGERPRLGLISAAPGEQEEDQHSSAEGDERCTSDRCLLAAAEDTEDEREPETQTRDDRAEDDQADVTSPAAFAG